MNLEVMFTPVEFEALARRDLRGVTAVVFDILRASTSMVTALENGAEAIIPVTTIAEALELRQRIPDLLLAGERDGLRILRSLTGSIDFDLGNSPREFTREKVDRRIIAMTTTNGTRALRACAHAGRVWVGSFRNLSALIRQIRSVAPPHVMILCSGTHEEAAYEDALAAGALCDALWSDATVGGHADSARIARAVYRNEAGDLVQAARNSRNGSRLSDNSELAPDIGFCLSRDVSLLTAELRDGRVLRV